MDDYLGWFEIDSCCRGYAVNMVFGYGTGTGYRHRFGNSIGGGFGYGGGFGNGAGHGYGDGFGYGSGIGSGGSVKYVGELKAKDV